eukprot:1153287-Pelagomonas_calceolata.AAC.3
MTPPPHPIRMPPDFAGGGGRPVGPGMGRDRPASATQQRPYGRAHLGEMAAGRPSAGAPGMSSRVGGKRVKGAQWRV